MSHILKLKLDLGNRAAALVALHGASQQQGMGFSHPDYPLSLHEATDRLNLSPHVDYLRGRIIKVDFTSHELDPRLYDRDNGDGAAERALEAAGLLAEIEF
jgi:hypothetical protein